MAAEHLNESEIARAGVISRFVALPHTEGCGVAGDTAEILCNRTLLGYLTHPCVHSAVVMEHGCEKTHNDYVRLEMEAHGIDPRAFGWVSIQLDGGIQRTLEKTRAWFTERLALEASPPPARDAVPISGLRVGLLEAGKLDPVSAAAMARLALLLAGAGSTVVIPQNASFLDVPELTEHIGACACPLPTLAQAGRARSPGLHIMEVQTDHWAETVGALGATGAEVLLACVGEQPLQGHPMLPVLQVTANRPSSGTDAGDSDLALTGIPEQDVRSMLRLLAEAASGSLTPRATVLGNTSFQISRGLLGVSM
jgi:altronate dehydratase